MSEIHTNMKQVQACITIQSLFRGWVARRPRAIIGTKRKRHKPNNYKPIAEIKQDKYVSGVSGVSGVSDNVSDNVSDHDTDSDYVQGSSEDSESSEGSSDSEDSEDSESDIDL